MGMYHILEMEDGKWIGKYRIQDGTESFEKKTRDAAIQTMIRDVKIMNGTKISESDILFFKEEHVHEIKKQFIEVPSRTQQENRCPTCRQVFYPESSTTTSNPSNPHV